MSRRSKKNQHKWEQAEESELDVEQLLSEESVKAAEKIEEYLFPEGAPEKEMSEAEIQSAYQRLVESMKKKGIYQEEATAYLIRFTEKWMKKYDRDYRKK